MSPTRSQPLVAAPFLERPNSTLYHPQLDESLYKTWELIILGILAGCVSLVTIFGNITVLMSFFLERSIRQPSNYFIASLAVSDLLIGTISMPLYTTYILTWKNWPLGEILCDLWLSIDYTACLCSIYTIFCITIDRFCSIRLPTKYRVWRTERKVLFVVFLTWAIPIVVFFTSIFGWQHFVGHRSVPNGKCYVQYMDDAFFNCFLQVGYFWTTLIAMFVLYAGIYRVALDLHRRSDEKRRRHLNSLATMAGCTIGQLGTVIGMSHGPKQVRSVGSVAAKEQVRTGSTQETGPDNGCGQSGDVRTISETVNVTSASSSQREMVGDATSVAYPPDDRFPSRETRTNLETIIIRGATTRELPSPTKHHGYQLRESTNVPGISPKKLPQASQTKKAGELPSPTKHHRYQLREATNAACFYQKKLLQASPTRKSDAGIQARPLRPPSDSITPLKTFKTRKRLFGKQRRNSELGLTAAAFFKAVEHIQECLILSAGQPSTRGTVDLPRGKETGEMTVGDRSGNVTVYPDSLSENYPQTCRDVGRANIAVSDELQEIISISKNDQDVEAMNGGSSNIPGSDDEGKHETTSGVFNTRTYSLCSDSPKRRFAMKRQNGRNLTKLQGQRLPNLIPSYFEANAGVAAGYSDPELVISPKFPNLARNSQSLTQRQKQPLPNLIHPNSEVNAEPVGCGYSDPALHISPSSADPARNDVELVQAGNDPNDFEQNRGQVTEGDFNNGQNSVRCFASDAQSGAPATVRNLNCSTLQKYRTETHLEWCSNLEQCSRPARIVHGDQQTILDNRGFLEGEDLPKNDRLRLCVSEADFPQRQRGADPRWERNGLHGTYNASPPKRPNQVQRGNDSITPGPDPQIYPARSARPQQSEEPRQAHEIFFTQTSSEHPVSGIKTNPSNATPAYPVQEDTTANPTHTILPTIVSPDSATSVPTSLKMKDDVNNGFNNEINNDVNDDVTNISQKPQTNEKNIDYLKVPGLEPPAATSAKQGPESGNEIREYDPRFEDRFPPGLKRLLQGSRRGQEESRRRPSEKQIKNENRARKALRTITIILGAFVMCWTPWHVLSLIIGFCSTSVVCVSPVLYDISYWLCYLNSPINPFCYAFVNQQFKKTFVRVLRLRWHRT